MRSLWKYWLLGLSLSLMIVGVTVAENVKMAPIGKTTESGKTAARSANRPLNRTREKPSDEDLFDTHLISQESAYEESAEASASAPTPECCDRLNGACGRMPFPPYPPSSDPDSMQTPAMGDRDSGFGSLSAGQGLLTAQADVPNFLGDLFSGCSTQSICGFFGETPIPPGTCIQNAGGNVGTMKLAENTSPLPRDRVFLSYNYFSNVPLVPGKTSVNRMTPGFEKTFFDGQTSVEFRVPMAWTASSTTDVFNQSGNTGQYEIGNVTTFFKTLVYQSEQLAVSVGSGLTAPTAETSRLVDGTNEILRIENRSVHLMPFLGAVYTPNDRWFAQGMLQFDIDTKGNPVVIDGQRVGRFNDPTYLFVSVSSGYWVYQDRDSDSFINGIAPFLELHSNTGLQSTDKVEGNGICIGNPQHVQTQNLVIGVNTLLDQDKTLLLGYVTPLGGGVDRGFDGEFRLVFNWFFGGQPNRQGRVQF